MFVMKTSLTSAALLLLFAPLLAFSQTSVIVSEREPTVVYDPSELNPIDPRYEYEGPTLLQDIRVIDGTGAEPVEGQDVLVVDGKIAATGPTGSLEAPGDARVIDGDGLTVLPGLIDVHGHFYGGWRGGNDSGIKPTYVKWQLLTYLYAGVTHVHDIGTPFPDVAADVRDQIAAGAIMGPDATMSGQFFETAPVGAAGESMLFVNPSADAVGGWLDKQKHTFGVEMVKCHAGTSPQILKLVVSEALERDMRVVCDLWHLNGSPWIADMTGLHGYAHNSFMSIEPSPEDAARLAELGTFITSTTVMYDTFGAYRVQTEGDYISGNSLIEDVQPPAWIEAARSRGGEESSARYQSIFEGIMGTDNDTQRNWVFKWNKMLIDAGVLLGVGTDAPYTNNWTGESMHREMELWVNESGISPIQTIKGATHNNARILKIEDRTGSIAVGLEGDLLVVEGNPAENISDSRNIRYVFNNGKIVDRESLTRQWKH